MTMTSIRLWHSYIGLFIAPSVLFFALTGALQIFSLHEAHGKYEPPVLIEKLSSVHKDQVFALGDHHDHDAPEANAESSAPDEGGDKSTIVTTALKIFFLVVALSLALSTALGLWMGFTQIRRKKTAWLLVAAGALIPAALLIY